MKHNISKYQQEAFNILNSHKDRLHNILDEAWFNKKSKATDDGPRVISIEEASQLVKKSKGFFLKTIQDMLKRLKTVFNRKYLQDYGPPRSAKYSFTHNPDTQELVLHCVLRIKGRSNNFLYKTKTTFYLTPTNTIRSAESDEFQYMIASYGNQIEVQYQDSIKDLESPPKEMPGRNTRQAKGELVKDLEGSGDTIRL